MKISDNTSVSMPMRNLLSIVGACIVGAWFGFGVIETEVPNIKKNDMTIQFHEERIIDLEEKNGYHD